VKEAGGLMTLHEKNSLKDRIYGVNQTQSVDEARKEH
jgi:hypothetical protein